MQTVVDKKDQSQSTEPDYRFWLEKDVWQLVDAAKLLCGRDPLGRFPDRARFNGGLKVIGVIDLAFEQIKEGKLPVIRDALIPNHVLVDPAEFVEWAGTAGLEVPPPFAGIIRAGAVDARIKATPAILKDRAMTVAKTLWVVNPSYTVSEVINHKAMKTILADERLHQAQLIDWVSSLRPES